MEENGAVRLVIGVREAGGTRDLIVDWHIQLPVLGRGASVNLISQSRRYPQHELESGLAWARERGARLAAQHGYELASIVVRRQRQNAAATARPAATAAPQRSAADVA